MSQKLLSRIVKTISSLERSLTTEVKGPFNYINGCRVDPSNSKNVMKVGNPATGDVLCEVPVSGKGDVDHAVSNAKEAFNIWSKMSPMERGRLLTAAGKVLRDNREDIARLEVLDTGKPIWEARNDLLTVIDCLEYYGGIIPSHTGQHVPLSNGSFALVMKEPLGIVGGVGAWNFPMQTCTWKVAPAIAAGNTFVYKPSQFTPLTAITLGEILTQVGVPAGVYNVIQGEGETGAMLSEHPDLAKLSFTGSVSTGVKIMSAAARGVKYCTLELGGKSPLVIFEDAHLENAVKATLLANFLSQGEVCSNGTRVFVHKDIYTKFTDKLRDATLKLKVGDPFHEDTTVGATITPEHAHKVLGYIDSAKSEGANIECGGERVKLPPPFSGGWYLSPCILTNCHDDMKVVREEVFGSVVALLPFETEQEVLVRANDTPFGLGGGVFTRDLCRAHRVASSIQAGSVWINTFNLTPVEVPFGGYKMSGVGRENGTGTLDFYTQTKTVYVEMGDVDAGNLYI